MAVKKKSKGKSTKKESVSAKQVKKKVEKPQEKKEKKREPKKEVKKGDTTSIRSLKSIFTSNYFIIGLIVLIVIILCVAFVLSSREQEAIPEDNNTQTEKVIFTVYADYMSPTLAAFYAEDMKNILAENPNIEFDFQLYGGIEKAYFQDWGDSERAKKAELCAEEQGKEAEMRDLLLTSAYKDYNAGAKFGPGIYTDEKINEFVKELNLDKKAFDACYTSPEKQQIVDGLLQSVYSEGLLSVDPVFKYNGSPFAFEILEQVASNITEGKPIKPDITVKIIGKTGLDFFEQRNTNNFKAFDFYYNVSSEFIDAESEAGKKLISDLGIDLLPAYIFEGQFTESPFYEKVKDLIDNDSNILGLYKTATLVKVGVESYYSLADLTDFINTLSQDYSMGDKDAKLTIIEFSDYLCPYCKKFHTNNFEKLKADYIDTGKVKFYYLQWPVHQTSTIASLGAMCAGEQGAYWKYHMAVFGKYTEFTDDVVKKVAQDLNLDTAKFNECYDKKAYDLEMQNISDYAVNLGFNGTPGFIVGHVFVPGYMEYEVFKSIIDYELSQQ